jgi:hypothetical protein
MLTIDDQERRGTRPGELHTRFADASKDLLVIQVSIEVGNDLQQTLS